MEEGRPALIRAGQDIEELVKYAERREAVTEKDMGRGKLVRWEVIDREREDVVASFEILEW